MQKSYFPAYQLLQFLSAVPRFSPLNGGSSSLLEQAVLLNHALKGKVEASGKALLLRERQEHSGMIYECRVLSW